jgi:hypothetical protein
MKDYREIVAGMYIRHSLKQCIGTTAYIQFMENHNKSIGSDHCFKHFMRHVRGGVGLILTTAFLWNRNRQGQAYWNGLSSKWDSHVIVNSIDRTLSHILENTERR